MNKTIKLVTEFFPIVRIPNQDKQTSNTSAKLSTNAPKFLFSGSTNDYCICICIGITINNIYEPPMVKTG